MALDKSKTTIIYGGPGCGKTRYLIDLLEKLLLKYEPEEIAFVSFTKKGAYEGRDRAIKKFNFEADRFPYFRTLHSIAFKECGLSKKNVLGRRHYKQFGESLGMKFIGYYTDEYTGTDDLYLRYYDIIRNNPVQADKLSRELNMKTTEFVVESMKNYKKAYQLYDFTDMLEMFLAVDKPLPVRVAIIDEAQDLTSLQWAVCELAFSKCDSIYVAGDDLQAIFEYGGADVDYFLNLQGKRVILEKSFRMPSRIHKFSQEIAKEVVRKVDKTFSPKEQGGLVMQIPSLDDLEFNDSESYYLLARNNQYLDYYEAVLQGRGIRYNRVMGDGMASMDRELGVIRSFLYKTQHGKYPTDIDGMRVKQYLKEGYYGHKGENWRLALSINEDRMDYFETILYNEFKGIKTTDAKITLSSVHGVKGGEADNVVVMLDMSRGTYKNYRENRDSELRVLYVACTRACKNLFIIPKHLSKHGYEDDLKIGGVI